jgi:hypothetical protein
MKWRFVWQNKLSILKDLPFIERGFDEKLPTCLIALQDWKSTGKKQNCDSTHAGMHGKP